MGLFGNQEICLIFVEIKTNKIMENTNLNNEQVKNPLRDPLNHSLEVLLNEIKRGRPAETQQLIQSWIEQLNKYNEEEVLNFTQTMIMQYKFGNTNIEQMDLLKENLQQFKNK